MHATFRGLTSQLFAKSGLGVPVHRIHAGDSATIARIPVCVLRGDGEGLCKCAHEATYSLTGRHVHDLHLASASKVKVTVGVFYRQIYPQWPVPLYSSTRLDAICGEDHSVHRIHVSLLLIYNLDRAGNVQ